MKLTFTDNADFWQKRFACLKTLSESQVDVGLTSSASARSLFLLAIHEHGAPVIRIPPRPVIQPALSDDHAREEMADALMEAVSAAMERNEPGVTAALEQTGKAGVDAIHRYIDAGVPPPCTIPGWVFFALRSITGWRRQAFRWKERVSINPCTIPARCIKISIMR